MNSENENKRLQFKRIQSISKDKNQLINGFEKEIFNFLKNEYDFVKELFMKNPFLKFKKVSLMEN